MEERLQSISQQILSRTRLERVIESFNLYAHERKTGLMEDVVIAGGGPTGLMLAGELALAGVDVAIVERRANQDLPGSRAPPRSTRARRARAPTRSCGRSSSPGSGKP